MKTLVYILPDKDAGVASVVRNLLRFKTNRYQTKVVLLHNTLDNVNRRIKDDFNADSIVRVVYNGKWSSKVSVSKKIINVLDEHSVLVSNDGGLELEALKYICFPLAVVYIMHGNIKHYFNAIDKHQNRISSIITVSDFLKQRLESKHTNAQSIKFSVPSPVDLKRSVDESVIRIVFVGSIINAKGVYGFKTILERLIAKDIPFVFTIIGSGSEYTNLQKSLVSFKSVIFKGKLPNEAVLELHTHHDIIILPSKTEGLPVVLVEAMKYGVVPMATNLESGIPELITNGHNGFTVPLDDFNGYANYIEELYKDRAQLKKMSELCIAKAEDLFHPYKQAKAYEDAFVSAKHINFKEKKHILEYLPMTISHRFKSYFTK